MNLYPSCLFNRIKEAERHLTSVKKAGLSFARYPYHIVDLSVRMRPVVEVIDKEQKKKPCIALVEFEPSKSFPANDKYINANKVEIMVLLGAIIHEQYIDIGRKEGDEETIRLTVASDRGRWTVKFSEFLDKLQSYILSQDEIASTVCQMIDNYREKVRNNEPKYRIKPPTIGNFDLEWLFWDYVEQEPGLKKEVMSKIFNVSQIRTTDLKELRFSANHIGHKEFDLYCIHDYENANSENKRRVSWDTLSKVVRSYLRAK